MCRKGVIRGVGGKVLLLVFSFLTIFTEKSAQAAGSVNLAWTASPDTSVVSYKVYYGGIAGVYTNSVSVGNVTTATVGGLKDGGTYYFAAASVSTTAVESDFSNETTYTVPVTSTTNIAPTLTSIANVTINEDAAQQTVSLSGITAGGSESQPLTVTASSSNTGLIPTPTVTYTSPGSTGSIRFTPAANAAGTATISVTVNDGQSANNTIVRTFTVTVNAVNDAPTLAAISNVTVNEDPGQQTVSLSGIGSGAANESQSLSVTASSSNTGLVPTPTITYSSPASTGSLRFTPTANSSGSATITVTVNDGQSANNTVTRSFTVTVNSANDAPTISAIANQSVGIDSSTPAIPFTIGDVDSSIGSLTVSASSTNTALVGSTNILLSGSGPNRTITIAPIDGQSGDTDVTIFVSDGVASASRTFHLSVTNGSSLPTALVVNTDGEGTVSPNLSLSTLVWGKNYSMTAKPEEGYEFAGWYGTFHSMDPKLSFVMNSNINVEARFVPSPYTPVLGFYNGLFYEEESVRLHSAGNFKLKVTAHGFFSGQLQRGATRHTFKGKFDLNLQATVAITPKVGLPMTLNLALGTNSELGEITGTLSDGVWTANVEGGRSAFHTTYNPAPQTGNYTIIIPGSDEPGQPEGNGHGTVSVKANGSVKFAGVLADGTKVSQSAYVTDDGEWPMFSALYKGAGSITSWLTFKDDTEDDINGALSWIKLTNGIAKYYPLGFTNETKAVGSHFTAPVAPAKVLALSDALTTFAGGNLAADVAVPIVIGDNSAITATTLGFKMKFTTSRGLFAGTVVDTGTGLTHKFSGAVFQKLNVGYGSMLGTNLSSHVLLAPPAVTLTSVR